MSFTYQTRIALRLSFVALSAALSACGSNNSNQNTNTPAVSIEQPVVSLSGRAMGGRQPINGAVVYVYAASGSSPSAPVQIGVTTTASNGTFSIASFNPVPATGDLIYVSSIGGDAGSGYNPQAALMTVAGTYGSLTGNVQINELTTVAAVSQLQSLLVQAPCPQITGNTASFAATCPLIKGQATGWSTQVSAITNLVNAGTGRANGSLASSSLQNMNLQASVLANCINSKGGVAGDSSACGNLLNVAKSSTANGVPTKISSASISTGFLIPISIFMTPDGKSLYTINQNQNTISLFSISSDGTLSEKNPAMVNIDSTAWRMAISPNGKTAYVPIYGSNIIQIFSIASDGVLSPHTQSSVETGNAPYGIAIAPDGKTAYVSLNNEGGLAIFSIGSNGALTAKNPATVEAGPGPTSVAIAPNGKTVYVLNNGSRTVSMLSVDSNGMVTPANPATVPTGSDPSAIVITPNGKFAYVTNAGDHTVSLFRIASNGTLIERDTVATLYGPSDITVAPDGQRAYVTNFGSNEISVFDIDSDGVLTRKHGFYVETSNYPLGIIVTPNGQTMYCSNYGALEVFKIGNGTPADSQTGLVNLHANRVAKASAFYNLKPVTAVYTPMPSSAPATLALP